MAARARLGPSLPRALLDELDSAAGTDRPGGRRGQNTKLSRKEARKQEREQKKARKANYYAGHAQPAESLRIHGQPDAKGKGKEKPTGNSTGKTAGIKRPAEDDNTQSPKRKKVKFAMDTKPEPKPATKEPSSSKTPKKAKTTPKKKQPTALEKLAARTDPSSFHSFSSFEPSRKGSRSQQEKEEDAYIAYMEKKLGWKKGGSRTSNYGKGLEDDGLDDLLRDIENIETSIFSSGADGEDHVEEEDEADMDYSSADEDEDGYSAEEDNYVSEEDEDEVLESEEDSGDSGAQDGEDEEWGGLGDASPDQTPATDVERTEPPPSSEKPVPGKRYIPPHLRNRQTDSESEKQSEEQLKLTRQLKGLLNRMSEQNIGSILDSTEELYRAHRRHDVTSTLTTLIIDGISSHSMLLDQYVVLHAALVASLHKIVGVEFAAYFVQNLVASYERHLSAAEAVPDPATAPSDTTVIAKDDDRGKEASNLLVLLSELFNFGVISHVLVYDIIRVLLEGELTELRVELLLKIARDAGQQLRSVDPTALKDIIQIVHAKLPKDASAMSSRTRFMVETLTNLKNNKIKKAAGGGAAGSAGLEAVERMKKFLSGLNKKKHVKTHEPLRVTLEDLHSAESKGKWWLVGAAWGGDPLVDRQQDSSVPDAGAKKVESTENVLLKLAKKQGMNTDIRRSIFVVLMSSEDYVDACERLAQLKLTEVQQREIIRVILHCCGNEKAFNPYYAFVVQQLCRNSHSYKITLQFCLWDFLRDLGETNVGGAEVLKNLQDDGPVVGFDLTKISDTRRRNVARAYAWWLAKDCCTLAVLKPVDFTILKTTTQRFFHELFTHLLISTQLSTPLLSSDPKDYPNTRNRGPIEEVFIKATRVQALALGLVYFLGEIFRQEIDDEGGKGFLKWANKVAMDTLRTGMDVVAGL